MVLPAVGRRVQRYFGELLLDPAREKCGEVKKRKKKKQNIYKGKFYTHFYTPFTTMACSTTEP